MIADLRAKDVLAELVGRVVESYHELGVIEHLDHNPLPSLQAIVEIAQDLKEVIYPGYQQRRNFHWTNVASHVGEILARVHNALTDQISRALRHESGARDPQSANEATARVDADAQERTIEFLKSLPRIRRLIATDVQAALDGDPAARSTDEIIFCYPGLEAITVYRLAHELHTRGVPLIPRMMTEWAHGRTGIDIHPGAQIGPGFFIDHGTGVVIGETCVIADHVKLYQGVTLGALSFQKDADGNLVRGTKRHPTLERQVIVYANATILGGGTIIGANSIIGAGVSVTKSVPPNTVVTVERPSLRFGERAA